MNNENLNPGEQNRPTAAPSQNPEPVISQTPDFENPGQSVQTPPTPDQPKPRKRGIPRKTFILIVVLALITAGLVYLAVATQNNNTPSTKQQPVKIDTTSPQTTLTISQNLTPLASPSAFQANINIDTGNNKVTTVQLELSYDPNILKNVDIAPGSFFQNPNILLKKIDDVNGRISYALGIGPDQPGINGTGTVATISFTLPTEQKIATSTAITFVPKTQVNAQGTGQSVLKQSFGATFSLGSPSTPTPTSFPSKTSTPSAGQ